MKFDPTRKRSKLRIEYRAQKKTWIGRIKFGDGERTPSVDLLTDSEQLAQAAYDRWFESGEPPCSSGRVRFEEAARSYVAAQKDWKGAPERLQRFELHVFARIGHVEVRDIKKHHVASVLDGMAQGKGLLAGYILKVRSDISRVLAALARSGAIEHNVARGLELAEFVEHDDRPRIILTDEEIVRFRDARGFYRELDMMALFARDLGGYRTSDLHAADWSHFDTAGWVWCKIRRPKTDGSLDRRRRTERAGKRRATRAYERVTHTIPDTVRGPLIEWWKAAGRPLEGPVFPLQAGPKAGQRKSGKGISYAKPLRKALWEANIRRPLPGYEQAVGLDKRKYCALQVDTDESRAVDFHSFRRAYITALYNAGAQDSDVLDGAGHTQVSTSRRYKGERVLPVNEKALPRPRQAGVDTPPVNPAAARKRAVEQAKRGVLDVLSAVASGSSVDLEDE